MSVTIEKKWRTQKTLSPGQLLGTSSHSGIIEF